MRNFVSVKHLGLLLVVGIAAAAAASGCGIKVGPLDKCEGVTCDGSLTCDPLDGVCKCGGQGGVICGPNGTCKNNVCSYACPTAVECVGSTALDPYDCTCKCGGQGGVVCTGVQVCDPETRACVDPNRCTGVGCSAGMSCDPADGQCKCGGTVCGAKELCVNSACKADLCYGVNCLGDTMCDSADGLCKCGGAGGQACQYGQSCECPDGPGNCAPEQRVCANSMRCENVVCAGGMTCDPADGSCKCGGPTGRTCYSGQTCDVVSGTCIGDDRCRGVTCRDGLACDPEDGLCKCGLRQGQYSGELCIGDQVCARWGDGGRCVLPCDPRPGEANNNCPVGKTCSWDIVADMAFCVTAGTKQEPLSCKFHTTDLATDCQAGLHCVKDADKDFGYCRHYCHVSRGFNDCPQNTTSGPETCQTIDGAPDSDWGACVQM